MAVFPRGGSILLFLSLVTIVCFAPTEAVGCLDSAGNPLCNSLAYCLDENSNACQCYPGTIDVGPSLLVAPFLNKNVFLMDAQGRQLKYRNNGDGKLGFASGNDITFDIVYPPRSDGNFNYDPPQTNFVALKGHGFDGYFRHAGYTIWMSPFATYVAQTPLHTSGLAYDYAWQFIPQSDGTFKMYNQFGGGWWLGYIPNQDYILIVNGEANAVKLTVGSSDAFQAMDPGRDCQSTGFAVRYVLDAKLGPDNPTATYTDQQIIDDNLCPPSSQGWFLRHTDGASSAYTEVHCIYEDQASADLGLAWFTNPSTQAQWPATLTAGPLVKRWVLPSTDAPIEVPPTGMEVDSVSFSSSCATSGCWVIAGTITTGEDLLHNSAFNTFFLPHAATPASSLSYDFDYTTGGNGAAGVAWTFEPARHPCTSANFDAAGGNAQEVTTCCITNATVGEAGGFVANYRPLKSFVSWAGDLAACASADGEVIDRPGYDEVAAGFAAPTVSFPSEPLEFLSEGSNGRGGDGEFKGMDNSPGVTKLELTDPFFGQYDFEIQLDEVELRSMAGQLRGTVGVEHTVDTFLGLASFRTTGLVALDTFATQVSIHLEKTSFFTVSSNGVNQYTFLEYVNLRLVSIYLEDTDFSGSPTGMDGNGNPIGDTESENRTVRTNATGNVNYLQVTFTLGSQYNVNTFPDADLYSSGLIPLNSVRAGRGEFMGGTTLESVCAAYQTAADDNINGDSAPVGITYAGVPVSKGDFDDAVDQSCGPGSTMCASPTDIPDHFVSFNIPLGSQVFDGQASDTLSSNIFVDLVVNAVDESAPATSGGGDAPMQMKTTLTASIPIVEGGVNIFCDGVTAKTDLKDVANADIIVGTAESAAELARLRIVTDVASTSLGEVSSATIDTDSIEAALMTLVLKGNAAYFAGTSGTNANTIGFSLELDDLVTLHLMTDGQAPSPGGSSTDTAVAALLAEPAEDNSDGGGLQTEGYKLNGAFELEVDRGQGIAKLQPTPELLALCPFNPPRPAAGNSPLESCVLRRDVQQRGYPRRAGAAFPTAMEIFNYNVMEEADSVVDFDESQEEAMMAAQDTSPGTAPCPSATFSVAGPADWATAGYACEAGWLTGVLGDSEYARGLAKSYVAAIRTRYDLNGRYTRAYWINPGYEWTPTQTGGTPIFSVSQKVYLFALITMDENLRRRRMLLQGPGVDPTQDSGSAAGAASLEFAVTPTSLMAAAFEVPEDKVALFSVELQLTHREACLTPTELQSALRLTLVDYLDRAASPFETVQITALHRDVGTTQCRRASRQLLTDAWSDATAVVTMLVVFTARGSPVLNTQALAGMPGVAAVTPDPRNSPDIAVDDTFSLSGGQPDSGPSDTDEKSSSQTVLIAAIAGGVGAAVAVGGAVLFMRARAPQPEVVVGEAINIQDLKSQLQQEC